MLQRFQAWKSKIKIIIKRRNCTINELKLHFPSKSSAHIASLGMVIGSIQDQSNCNRWCTITRMNKKATRLIKKNLGRGSRTIVVARSHRKKIRERKGKRKKMCGRSTLRSRGSWCHVDKLKSDRKLWKIREKEIKCRS